MVILKFQVKKEFQKLDTDGDGNISVAELEVLLKSIKGSLKMTDTEIKKLLKTFDDNGDGNIDTREFLNIVTTGEKRITLKKNNL